VFRTKLPQQAPKKFRGGFVFPPTMAKHDVFDEAPCEIYPNIIMEAPSLKYCKSDVCAEFAPCALHSPPPKLNVWRECNLLFDCPILQYDTLVVCMRCKEDKKLCFMCHTERPSLCFEDCHCKDCRVSFSACLQCIRTKNVLLVMNSEFGASCHNSINVYKSWLNGFKSEKQVRVINKLFCTRK